MDAEFRFSFTRESQLEAAISKSESEIAKIHSQKAALEDELNEAGSLRRLLFENGRPLEKAILEALRHLGFKAEPFSDGESEFDSVFVSAEGRCLGEAEGKDRKAISIEKFSQLERNIQEDFARDGVTQYAKGVLFGNAHRLSPLDKRGEFFTDKCMTAARRVGAALVRTPDLFFSAKYMKENPNDGGYALRCREAICLAEGELVIFPPPPVSQKSTVVENRQSKTKKKSGV